MRGTPPGHYLVLLPPTAVRHRETIHAERGLQRLLLVGERPDALPHPAPRGRPPRAAVGLATSDNSRQTPSSRDVCHPSGDSSDASTCLDPAHRYFTFKRVGLHYKSV